MSTILTKTQIWGAPIALAIVSAVGLTTALLADGLWDAVSWIALAMPVAVSARSLWSPRRSVIDKRTPPHESLLLGVLRSLKEKEKKRQ